MFWRSDEKHMDVFARSPRILKMPWTSFCGVPFLPTAGVWERATESNWESRVPIKWNALV